MKKTYVKPVVYAESFELMEHIAGGCVVNDGFAGALHRGPDSCGYQNGNITLFESGVDACADAIELFSFAGVENPTFADLPRIGLQCYNAFLDTQHLFAS